MKRITSIEIQCLKELLKDYRDRNIMLSIENDELRKQLEESRAKEGKGALEKMMDGIADAVVGLGKMFSSMSPDELMALAEADDHDLDNLEIEGQEDDDNAI